MSLLEKFFSENESAPPSSDGIKLVVGLGNPGPEYDGTRHNIGFDLVDHLASDAGCKWSRERKFRSKVAKRPDGTWLCKPLTFMNLSGTAVARLVRFHKWKPEQILVVYDDVDLAIGRIRFREKGSAGGHNGIKSMISSLATDAFPRLKIGIGASGGDGMVDHVLGKFTAEEQAELEKVLAFAVDGVNCALADGLAAAMNEFNRK